MIPTVNIFDDFLPTVHYHIGDDATHRPIHELSTSSVLTALAIRIKYIAMTVIYIPLTTVFTIRDSIHIIRFVRHERHCNFFTALKLELVLLTGCTIGYIQLLLNILCPEIMLTGTCDCRKLLEKAAALFQFYCVTHQELLFQAANYDSDLLPDHGARLQNFKAELYESITNSFRDNNWGSDLSVCCKSIVARYYDADTLFYANKWIQRDYQFRTIVKGSEEAVLANINNGFSIDTPCWLNEQKSAFEMIVHMKGAAFAQRALVAYMNAPTGWGDRAQKFLTIWKAIKNVPVCRSVLYEYVNTYQGDELFQLQGFFGVDFIRRYLLDNDINLEYLKKFTSLRTVAAIVSQGLIDTTVPYTSEALLCEHKRRTKTRIQQFITAVAASTALPAEEKQAIFSSMNFETFLDSNDASFATSLIELCAVNPQTLKEIFSYVVQKKKHQVAHTILKTINPFVTQAQEDPYFLRSIFIHALQTDDTALALQSLDALHPNSKTCTHEVCCTHLVDPNSPFLQPILFLNNKTALDLVIEKGSQEITQRLLCLGALSVSRDATAAPYLNKMNEKFGLPFALQALTSHSFSNISSELVKQLLLSDVQAYKNALFDLEDFLSEENKCRLLIFALSNSLDEHVARLYKKIALSSDLIKTFIISKRNKQALELIKETLKNPISKSSAIDIFYTAFSNDFEEAAFLMLDSIDIDSPLQNTPIENQTPLMLAAARKWKKCVERLIQKGASLTKPCDKANHHSWYYITQNFDESFLEQLVTVIPLECEKTNSFICACFHKQGINKPAYAKKLLARLEQLSPEQEPSWWKSKENKTDLFEWAVDREFLEWATKLLPHIDVNYVDSVSENKTPLMFLAANKLAVNKPEWLPLIKTCIERGAHLLARNTKGRTAYDYLKKALGAAFITECMNLIPLENDEVKTLLCNEMAKKNCVDNALILYARIQKNPPAWWDNKAKGEFFFLAAEQQNQTIMLELLPFVDAATISPTSKKQSALMIACEQEFGEAVVTRFLEQGANLLHKDHAGRFAFQYLAATAYTPPPKLLYPFLHHLGLRDFTMIEHFSWNRLFAYLSNDIFHSNAPLVTRIACAFFFEEVNHLNTSINSLRNLQMQEKLKTIDHLLDLFGNAFQLHIDRVFTPTSSHYRVAASNAPIPAKKASVVITEMTGFYEAYIERKSEEDKTTLQTFLNRVTQRVAYLGTPDANSNALEEFYTVLDNATCNVISHFNEALIKLSQENNGKTALQLATENNSAAKDLISSIRTWLRDSIEAAHACGGRIYANAMQQYALICLKKREDAQSIIFTTLASMRENIASSLFQEQGQSVHAYNSFINFYGRQLGIPGTNEMQNFNDRFAHSQQEADEAHERFVQRYTPSALIEMIQNTLQGAASDRDLFMAYLKLLIKKPLMAFWNDRECDLLKNKLALIWNDTALTLSVKKERVSTFLQNAPYYMTLDDNDLQSLDTIAAEIKSQASDGRLFIAKCMKQQPGGTTFTDNAILAALVDLGVLA